MNTNLNDKTTRHPELVSESTRHCERSEAIWTRLPRPNGLAMTNESGRSMVEMLGVLAVIGVLSITGISGYTTAMNKHKANEILDAASKRAVAVSTQIQRGNTSPTLDEFGDDDDNTIQGVQFGTPTKVGDNQFKLPLDWSGISDEDQQETLCQYMQQYISEDGTNATALIDSDCTRILYNSDLSVGVSNTNNRDADDSTKCATGYTGADCDSCATNYGLHNGTCVACSTVGASGTISTVLATGYTGCYCGANQTWENSQCKSAQKKFYITSSPTDHYNAATACSSLTVDGGGWHLASLSEFFEGIGGTAGTGVGSCTLQSGNYYTGCSSYLSNLNLPSGQSISYVWLKDCWESGDGGKGTSCDSSTSGYAWNVGSYGYVFNSSRDRGIYALCVR